MITDLPICINCKHYFKTDRGQLCRQTAEMNLVNGETTYLHCSVARESTLAYLCGRLGQYYEKNIGDIHDDE